VNRQVRCKDDAGHRYATQLIGIGYLCKVCGAPFRQATGHSAAVTFLSAGIIRRIVPALLLQLLLLQLLLLLQRQLPPLTGEAGICGAACNIAHLCCSTLPVVWHSGLWVRVNDRISAAPSHCGRGRATEAPAASSQAPARRRRRRAAAAAAAAAQHTAHICQSCRDRFPRSRRIHFFIQLRARHRTAMFPWRCMVRGIIYTYLPIHSARLSFNAQGDRAAPLLPPPTHPGATQVSGGRHGRRTPPWSPTADIHHGSGVRKRRRGEGLFCQTACLSSSYTVTQRKVFTPHPRPRRVMLAARRPGVNFAAQSPVAAVRSRLAADDCLHG
jgi:hypothetical protein